MERSCEPVCRNDGLGKCVMPVKTSIQVLCTWIAPESQIPVTQR